MARVLAVLIAVITILILPLAGQGQQAGKVYKIGSPNFSSAPAPDLQAALEEGLRSLGWVEGQNLVFERRCCAAGSVDRLNEFIAELVRLKVDLLLVGGPQAAAAAKKATSTIPIVFVGVARPVEIGLIESFARPGGNVTGPSHVVAEGFVAKMMELLKETVPSLSRLALLINPTNPVWQTVDLPKAMAESARSLKLNAPIQILEARSSSELAAAFDTATRQRAQGLVVPGDTLFSSERRALAALAVKHRLPMICMTRETVEVGGLMSYGSSLVDLYRRTAVYIDKVLRGANPGEIPVERPTKFELVINMQTARALGLSIPRSLLARADEVIQ